MSTNKQRYRTDEAYRQHIIATAKKSYSKLKKDPLYRKFKYVISALWNKRLSIQLHWEKIQQLEKEIAALLKLKAKVQEKRRQKRNGSKARTASEAN